MADIGAPSITPASAYVFAVLVLWSLHACFDCVCTVCTVLAHIGTPRYPRSGGGFVAHMAGVYSTLLLCSRCQDEPVATEGTDLAARMLAYFVAACSLTRAVAVVCLTPSMCYCVCTMYALQALAAEFEGVTTRAVPIAVARTVSFVCACMAVASAFVPLYLDA